MVTLANIQGQTLVPDLSRALQTALTVFGTPQTREDRQRRIALENEAVARRREIDDLTRQIEPGAKRSVNQAALLRLNALDPQIGRAVLGVIQSGNEQTRENFRAQAELGAKNAIFISGQKDFAAKQRAISSLATAAAGRGEPLERFIELQNFSPSQLDLELQRMKIAGQDLQTILKPAAAPLTAIGKARADLRAGLITSQDFAAINRAPVEFQSSVGKLIGDQKIIVDQFGAGSPQAQAIGAAITSEQEGEGPNLSDVGGLRKEFTKQSGDFIKIRDAIKKVRQAAQNPSAAGDLSLIFNFMKILDPGSTVREGEFATAQNAASVTDRIRAQYNRVTRGERLIKKTRQDFVDTAARIFGEQRDSQILLENSFRGIAQRQRFDPQNVVIDFLGPERPPPPPGRVLNFDAQGNQIQ